MQPRMRQAERSVRASAPVFSYHTNRAARPEAARDTRAGAGKSGSVIKGASAAMLRGKHVNWLKRGPVLLGAALAMLVLLANLVVSTSPRMQVADVQNGRIFLRAPSIYLQAAHNMLAGSLLNRNKITIDTHAIANRMQAQFPELASVSIELPLVGTQPIVYVQPAAPKLLLTSTGGTVYVVDENGRALILASKVARLDTLQLPMVTDQSGLTVGLGKPTLPSSSISFITEVVGQLNAKNLHIKSMTLPQASSELDVQVSSAPYIIKFNLRGNGRVEAGTYLAVAAQLAREHKTPTTYIDVRVDQRAYYK